MEMTDDQTCFSIYCSTLCDMQPLYAVVANMVELIKSYVCWSCSRVKQVAGQIQNLRQ